MVRWYIRRTRLTLVCEVTRHRLVQVWKNLKRMPFGVSGRQSPFCIFPLSLSSSFYFLSFSKPKSEGDNLLQIMLRNSCKLGFHRPPVTSYDDSRIPMMFLVILIITVYLFSSSQHQNRNVLFFHEAVHLLMQPLPVFFGFFFNVTLFHNWNFFWPSLTAVSFFFFFFF